MGAGNKKLFIILGSAGAGALVLILTLVLVLGGGSPYYSELVNCSDVESDLGLEGREARSVPALYADRDVNANVDTFVECEGEDETGEVELLVLLLTPSYAEQDGAMEGRADLVHYEEQEDGNNYVEHEVSVGDHSRALDDENMGSPEDSLAFVTYASGNLVLACAAEGAGTPEERIDRAIAACGSYEDAMKAQAPTI
ncbi:hypothetical protein [Nocardiopsis potens]|uniref:hypothetical protein n=1 Tax=Nocardiopsis potens TaxID=1246458 RepID=UPI0003485A63|nr:hypothetical protein [Nocardiopsis potens]